MSSKSCQNSSVLFLVNKDLKYKENKDELVTSKQLKKKKKYELRKQFYYCFFLHCLKQKFSIFSTLSTDILTYIFLSAVFS